MCLSYIVQVVMFFLQSAELAFLVLLRYAVHLCYVLTVKCASFILLRYVCYFSEVLSVLVLLCSGTVCLFCQVLILLFLFCSVTYYIIYIIYI